MVGMLFYLIFKLVSLFYLLLFFHKMSSKISSSNFIYFLLSRRFLASNLNYLDQSPCPKHCLEVPQGQGSNLCRTAVTRATAVRTQKPQPAWPSENSGDTLFKNYIFCLFLVYRKRVAFLK